MIVFLVFKIKVGGALPVFIDLWMDPPIDVKANMLLNDLMFFFWQKNDLEVI